MFKLAPPLNVVASVTSNVPPTVAAPVVVNVPVLTAPVVVKPALFIFVAPVVTLPILVKSSALFRVTLKVLPLTDVLTLLPVP